MESNLLFLLLLIASSWARQCPGNSYCQKREISSAKSLYVHYGIIDDSHLYATVLEDNEDVEIIKKFSKDWPKISDLSSSPKNKAVLGATFVQCKFNESTAISDAIKRIFDRVNISKLKIESSSFGDVRSEGNFEDSPLRKEYLEDFKGLQELSLEDNGMQDIDDDFFEGFDNLTKLSLSNNKMIRIFPKLLEPLLNLEYIDLSENKFSTLNSLLLRKNTKLKSFVMSNNDQLIPTFPDGLFKNLTNLKEVNLANSKIMQLTGDLFEGTTGLKKMDLSKNHLSYIPPKLFRNCTNLEFLSLSSNFLSSDAFISNKAFSALNNLVYLNVSHNKITSLNSNLLAGLTSLEILDMSHNSMITIDPGVFSNLNKLQSLDFSYNYLTLKSDKFTNKVGPISSFHFVKKSVQYINLAHNNISDMFRDWASGLQKLDLSFNYITSLKASDLEFLTITDLDLSSNKIEEIKLGEIEMGLRINPSVRVKIDDNPLLCDCKMYNTIVYLAENDPLSYIINPKITKELNCDRKNITEDNSTCERINFRYEKIGTCPHKCTCKVRPEDQSFLIDCSYRGLLEVPTDIAWIPGANLEVDLTGNFIRTMQSKNPNGFEQITVLSLSDNAIEEIPTNLSFNSLRELYLDNNFMVEVNDTVLDKLQASKVLKNLTLHDNKWKFDCGSSNLFTFIEKMRTKIPELQKVTFGEISFVEINYNKLCPVHLIWVIIAFITILSIGMIIGSVLIIYRLYSNQIKFWLYARGWCLQLVTEEEELDKDKIYDAFISFSYKDEEFIVTELVPKLEQGAKPLRICVNYHNWMAGEWVPQQTNESVNISRRTIIVLSPNYLDSAWGELEINTIHNEAIKETRGKVIFILYGDIQSSDITNSKLKSLIKWNTCIKWTDPWFWDKLRYALPHKKEKDVFENHRPMFTISNDPDKSIADSSFFSVGKSSSDSYYI